MAAILSPARDGFPQLNDRRPRLQQPIDPFGKGSLAQCLSGRSHRTHPRHLHVRELDLQVQIVRPCRVVGQQFGDASLEAPRDELDPRPQAAGLECCRQCCHRGDWIHLLTRHPLQPGWRGGHDTAAASGRPARLLASTGTAASAKLLPGGAHASGWAEPSVVPSQPLTINAAETVDRRPHPAP